MLFAFLSVFLSLNFSINSIEPIFTDADSNAMTLQSAVTNLCAALDDITAQTSSEMAKTKPRFSQLKKLPHDFDNKQAGLLIIKTATYDEGFHQLYNAEADST